MTRQSDRREPAVPIGSAIVETLKVAGPRSASALARRLRLRKADVLAACRALVAAGQIRGPALPTVARRQRVSAIYFVGALSGPKARRSREEHAALAQIRAFHASAFSSAKRARCKAPANENRAVDRVDYDELEKATASA
jgi:DNA-binding Lrp family transcriptional regulator